MPPRSLRTRILLAVASPLLVIGSLEIVLRLRGFSYPSNATAIVVWNTDQDDLLAHEDSLHRDSVRQLWEPRPGALVAAGGDERINPSGYRGPRLSPQREPGLMRVATLGDSSTFGLGVGVEETWTALLPALLAERGRPAEVLNGGVVGFTLRQGLERYRELVRPHRPDVVVAAFGAINEHHMAPSSLPDADKIAFNLARAGWSWSLPRALRERSRCAHLMAFYVDRARGGRVTERLRTHEERMRFRNGARRTGSLEVWIGQSEWSGVRRVGAPEFAGLLEELRAEVEADGARLILLSMPRAARLEREAPVLAEYSRALGAAAVRAGAGLVDARTTFVSIEGAADGTPPLLQDDVHPTASGHAHIADLVVERLVEMEEG